MSENRKLFREWYFKARKPLGFSFNEVSNIRESLDRIERLEFLNVFKREQMSQMKSAYLKKWSRKS